MGELRSRGPGIPEGNQEESVNEVRNDGEGGLPSMRPG